MAQNPAQTLTKIGVPLARGDVRDVARPGGPRRPAFRGGPRVHAIGSPRTIEEAMRLDGGSVGDEPLRVGSQWTQDNVMVDDSYGLTLGVAAVVLIIGLMVSFALVV